MKKAKVANCRYSDYDIKADRTTPFGNPYRLGVDGDRNEVCEKHIQWLDQWINNRKEIRIGRFSNKYVIKHLYKLRDKRIGCWCTPLRCHVDFLVELVNNLCMKK